MGNRGLDLGDKGLPSGDKGLELGGAAGWEETWILGNRSWILATGLEFRERDLDLEVGA